MDGRGRAIGQVSKNSQVDKNIVIITQYFISLNLGLLAAGSICAGTTTVFPTPPEVLQRRPLLHSVLVRSCTEAMRLRWLWHRRMRLSGISVRIVYAEILIVVSISSLCGNFCKC